jgi:hypothetical protein
MVGENTNHRESYDKLNFPQKNRAEHGAFISEEKQTLLSKRKEKLQSKLSPARCYIELTFLYLNQQCYPI